MSLPPQNVPLSRVDKCEGMKKMAKIPRKAYTLEFKQEAVRLVESGQRVSEAARSLGMVEQTLSNWVKAYRAGKLRGSGRSAELTAEQIEIRRLRAELARVTMERVPDASEIFSCACLQRLVALNSFSTILAGRCDSVLGGAPCDFRQQCSLASSGVLWDRL